ncbi:hypothetical protein GM418_11465 [Maribellus comscasis]|uniref:Uncharacterized protein n=1 Tax=Maribellus comscasis TaxID=2681766 RepID=A0A6I6JP61_9BACT|nr:hypothetical protein [Maribellus comscasis]QGY44251.1 hypothetical protein GM418_11465 [Maribellus comscasis]
MDNEQKAAMDRAAMEEQLQQQKKNAYLSTLDTIINVFGQESAIAKAALLAKQAHAIATTVINIAKGTGESAAAAPFPLNIPLIIGFVGQVAGLIATIKGATKKTKAYATGKYPEIQFAGRPKTGMYSGPHLGLFNEVSGQPEMVIDGITTRRIRTNAPEILDAIYSYRDGHAPRYADGKYPEFGNTSNSSGAVLKRNRELEVIENFTRALDENTSATRRFMTWKPYVSIETIEKKLQQWNEIKKRSRFSQT